jgi:large subunit ribosomal protein L31
MLFVGTGRRQFKDFSKRAVAREKWWKHRLEGNLCLQAGPYSLKRPASHPRRHHLKGVLTTLIGRRKVKSDIHPEYHPVIFRDVSTGDEIASRSTMTSGETRDVDGVSHYVVSCDITSFTHPFFTGKQKLMDTEGRIDRFRKKYGNPLDTE